MMNDNLVDPLTGASSRVLLSPPNADQTHTLRSTRSLANLVAACVRGVPGVEGRLMELSTPAGGARPGNTFQAMVSIAHHPANNAGALFNQSQGVPTVYSPPLFSAPDAWTLAVKVNDSGDDGRLFGGPANVAFDRDAPWGLCVDGDDHVWVGNFGALALESDFTYAGLTRLAGANPGMRPAGLNAGDAISPPTGYTLPSAGQPVLLHDGDPGYKDGTECYSPLMRSTSCQIDQAGNVWVVNNWKPRFRTNFPPDTGNPGGEGVVIFVGLAKPQAWPWAEPSS